MKKTIRRYCGASIAISFLAATLLFLVLGYDVAEIWLGIYSGAFGAPGAVLQTLRWTILLALIAAGIVFSLRTGEFNIGAQGQLAMGGLGAVITALHWPAGSPFLVIPAALVAGIIFGVFWSEIAGLLKVFFGTNEVITTLMLNFIAALLVQWITTGPLRDAATQGQSASTPRISAALRLSDGTGVSPVLIAIVVIGIAAAQILAERTPFGFKSRLTGSNALAAMWQGVSVSRTRLLSYAAAGAFAGLAGALEVLGPNGRLVTGATPSVGFTAIIVAIVGGLSIPGVLAAALLFGALQSAILFLPIVSSLPPSGLRIVEGLIALLITVQVIRGNK